MKIGESMIEPRQHGHFKINGASIYYRIYGGGEQTLFFLHGNGEDWTCFQKQITYFAKDYRVVTMDSRGHGKSGVSYYPLTIKQLAKDTAVLITKLQLTNLTLIGFSDGGNIAIEMVVHELVNVERMVIAGANLNPRGIKMRYQLPIILGHRALAVVAKALPKLRVREQILGLMTQQPNIKAVQLQKVAIPTLVIAGEKDMIQTKHTKHIAALLRDSTLVIIPKADHFVFTKQSEQVNNLVKAFVESH